jgi:hypothetical protein
MDWLTLILTGVSLFAEGLITTMVSWHYFYRNLRICSVKHRSSNSKTLICEGSLKCYPLRAGSNPRVSIRTYITIAVTMQALCTAKVCRRRPQADVTRPRREQGGKAVEVYINSAWTERYGNAYIAEAIAWSENGNHATIYATDISADEADAKLRTALRELKLIPEPLMNSDQASS